MDQESKAESQNKNILIRWPNIKIFPGILASKYTTYAYEKGFA